MSPEQLTEDLLQRYGPTMALEDIAETMRISVNAVRNRVSLNMLGIPTFREGRRRLAFSRDVAMYFVSLEQRANDSLTPTSQVSILTRPTTF